jgi:hypothetical protein
MLYKKIMDIAIASWTIPNANSNVSTGGPHQHGENAALQMPIQM